MDKQTTYQNLRNEMMFLMQRHDNYHLAAYTVSATLWSLAVTQNQSWLALIPMLILLPISFRMCESRYAIESLSAYMSVCLEGETLSDWEYIHNRFNIEKEEAKNTKNKFESKASRIYKISKFSFSFLSIISALIFWAMTGHIENIKPLWLGILLLIFQLSIIIGQTIIWYKNMDSSKLKKHLIADWERVKEIEKNK